MGRARPAPKPAPTCTRALLAAPQAQVHCSMGRLDLCITPAGNILQVLEAAQPTGTSTGGASNPIWLAPEILRGGKATAASDVFSFG